MSTDKKRVQFRAPNRLIDRADALAAVLGEDRTDVLVTALREYTSKTPLTTTHSPKRSPPPITTMRSASSSSKRSSAPRRRQTSEC